MIFKDSTTLLLAALASALLVGPGHAAAQGLEQLDQPEQSPTTPDPEPTPPTADASSEKHPAVGATLPDKELRSLRPSTSNSDPAEGQPEANGKTNGKTDDERSTVEEDDQRVRETGGDTIHPADFRGKPTIVEFWATWCPPCERTRATLTRMHADYGDRVHIVGISAESADRLAAFQKAHDLPYRLLRDPEGRLQEALSVTNLPTLFVVSADGTVLRVLQGAGHADTLRSSLDEMLGSDP